MENELSDQKLKDISSVTEEILAPADAEVYISNNPTVLYVGVVSGSDVLEEGDKILRYHANISSDKGDHRVSFSPDTASTLEGIAWNIAHQYHKHADPDIIEKLRESLFESHINYLK